MTIVSSAFQVIVLCAALVEMGIEMKRSGTAFPAIRENLEELHNFVMESMTYVLHPDVRVKDILVRDVFEVQESC